MATKIIRVRDAVPPVAPPAPQEFTLPILPVRDVVLYPSMLSPLVVTDAESIRLIDDVLSTTKHFGHVTVKEAGEKRIALGDLYEHGTRAEILKMLKFPDGSVRILVQGIDRIRVLGAIKRAPYITARVRTLPDPVETGDEMSAHIRNLTGQFLKMLKLAPYLPEELQVAVMNVNDPVKLAYLIASNLNLTTQDKQRLLEMDRVRDRLSHLEVLLQKEITILELGSRIQSEVQSEIGKNQREHLLREQMKVIQRELGEGDDRAAEGVDLREKVGKAKMPPEAEKVALDEIERLLRIPVGSSEYTVARTYVDWLVALPWSLMTRDQLDLSKARRTLDEDHDGLEKVKERILEYLAVRKLKPDSRGPILCFAGPPGVGKTSLGRSIARAMGRKFVRLSLGGVRDEAEIRGHRRTYVGALPGRVLQSLRKAASRNPIFMLDEIDKLGIDFRGDPASALLEVLDPEQNFAFSDHYLEVPFDLSRVMFITTANLLDPVPPALRDRMEVLELPGYTEEEKLRIARNHLVPKQVEENGLSARRYRFTDEALRLIITGYTREAGLRNLEREIGNICRKVARAVAERGTAPRRIIPALVTKWLGVRQFESEVADRCGTPGVATGLAWTMSGGELLFIEVTAMKGGKDLRLTGHLGDVMKESALAAVSYIRANASAMHLNEDFFSSHDLHIHVPAGAIPKDGPSAGITITVALVSLLLGRPVRPDVALTGEITLRGKVLPVGGIKEKVLAARRGGIHTVLLPARNRKDLKDVPAAVTRGMKFVYIDEIDDALTYIFDRPRKDVSPGQGPGYATRVMRFKGAGSKAARPSPPSPGGPSPRPEVRP